MQRRTLIFAAAVVIAGAGLLAWGLLKPKPIAKSPLDLLPSDTSAFLWLNVPRVRQSALWRRLESTRPEDATSVAEERCGFDPLDMIDEATVFIATKDASSFEGVGVVASGRLEHEKLVDCARKVIGGDANVVREVEIDGVRAIAARGQTHAAFIGSNGVAAGRKEVLQKLFRAMQGKVPTMRRMESMKGLWDDIATGRDAVLVGTLPERWRDVAVQQLHRWDPRFAAPLRAIRMGALGVTLSDGIDAGLILQLNDAATANELVRLLRGQVDATLEHTLVRLSPIGSFLRRIHLEATNDRLILTARASESEIDSIAEAFGEMSEVRLEDDEGNSGIVVRRPDAGPSETIPSAR